MDPFPILSRVVFFGGLGYAAYLKLSSDHNTQSIETDTKDLGPKEKKIMASTPTSFSVSQIVRMVKRVHGRSIGMILPDGKERTYEEFAERIARAGSSIVTKLGLKPETRVAILALNSPEYLEYFFVCPWAGCWVVPVNIRLAPPEVADVLNDCSAECLFVDDAFLPVVEVLKKSIPSLKHFVYIGSKYSSSASLPEGVSHYEELIKYGNPDFEAVEYGGDDVYGVFYTGGTTGKSKGVLLTHLNVMSNAYCVLNELQYKSTSIYLHAAPMFHAADGASTFSVTMTGATHAFIPKFTPVDTLEALTKYNVTHTLLVPTMFAMVLKVDNIGDYDLSKVQYFLYGASPMPEATLKCAMKTFSSAKFVQGYGMTECAPVNTFLSPEDHIKGGKLLSSAGRAVPHAELKVVDENDNEVPYGKAGELIVRGPHIMKGYYNMPEVTAAALKNGWMHTGDGAVMDENGYIYIKDRIKDMIITGGENVYSVEVENCLAKVPGVAMCAVIGIPDEKLVEKVTAIVVPSPGVKLTEDEITEFCHKNIAGYKCPRKIIIRTEPLPLSGAGKILKSELRKPFWEGHKEQIYSDANKHTNYQ